MTIRARLVTPYGAAVAGAMVAGAIFFAGMYVARATAGGETRRTLSYAGTLTGRAGPQTLTFTFRKGAATVCAPTVTATPDATTGAFAVEVPLSGCPVSLFDGADVTYEISVAGVALAPAQAISPVPYAVYADRVGTPDCPLGYERFPDATAPTGAILCRKGNDEMVRVGSGATAFWIDRYLSSVWSGPDGTGTRYDSAASASVGENGAFTTPAYAISMRGVPSTGTIGWRQANTLCRLVGKRLAVGSEWWEAARGTPGLGTPFGSSGIPRPDECGGAMGLNYMTDATPRCVSVWGMTQAVGYRWQWGEERGSGVASNFTTQYPTNFGAVYQPTPYGTAANPSAYNGMRCMMPR